MENLILNNGIFSSCVSCLIGNLVGGLADKATRIIEMKNLTSAGGTGHMVTKDTWETFVETLVQVGLIAVVTDIAARGMPWLSTDPGSYSLYTMGLWSSSPTLVNNLSVLNEALSKPIESMSLQAPQAPPKRSLE